MRCAVCGGSYGLFHDCPGPLQPEAVKPELVVRLRFAPLHYFREALAIARWDEAAIQRASRDNNALLYGLIFWSTGILLSTLGDQLEVWIRTHSVTRGAILTNIGLTALALPVVFLLTVGYFGLCHGIARSLLGGVGTFMRILRAMMLGSLVLWVGVVPVAGSFVANAWWGIAILLWVFEEVNGIERLHALAISIGVPMGLGLLIGLILIVAR